MGRGKVELKRIDNKISRQVTFSKRRSGLIKKAREISVLCEAHVALIVISSKGKLFEYSSDSSMETILERYERYSSAQSQFFPSSADQTQGSKSEEYPKLVNRIEVLQKNLRNTLGEDLDPLSSRELQNLEQQIDVGLKRIRTRKNQVMNETISNLQKKTKALQEQNNLMAKKEQLKESLNLFDESTNLEHQADITGPISTTLLLKPPPPGPSLIPSPSSSGDPKAGEVVEEDNERRAQTVPNGNRIPPWMLNHLTNQS